MIEVVGQMDPERLSKALSVIYSTKGNKVTVRMEKRRNEQETYNVGLGLRQQRGTAC